MSFLQEPNDFIDIPLTEKLNDFAQYTSAWEDLWSLMRLQNVFALQSMKQNERRNRQEHFEWRNRWTQHLHCYADRIDGNGERAYRFDPIFVVDWFAIWF